MMHLIKKKGTLEIRGYAILFVLIGLLVSGASSDHHGEEASFLRIKLDLLKNSYRELCQHYANLAPNCSGPVINCTECPEKWLHVGGHCFLLSTEKDNWVNSEKKCEEMGSHLAILTNREQHVAVEKEGRRLGAFNTYYWIGLTDIESEGDWKWVDNSTLKNLYWNTERSEPDNNKSGGEEGEDCVVVDSHSQSWYDVPCSFSYPRICQKDATPLI